MKFQAISTKIETIVTDCLVVGITPGGLSAEARHLDKVCGGAIRKAVKLNDTKGKIGEHLYLYSLDGIKSPRLLLLGCGDSKKIDGKKWAKLVHHAFVALNRGGSINATFCLESTKIKGKSGT